MRISLKTLLALPLAAAMTVAPAYAGDMSPVGKWQTTTGESRYEVSLCGNGAELCAKLTWLRPDARTDENLQYLNKYVVRGAMQSAPNRWRGTVRYAGEELGGSLTQVSPDTLRLSGCKVVCQSIEFKRI